jgi:ppGpp synthetase/RelA/SpoT-type nucleotidyltranferase
MNGINRVVENVFPESLISYDLFEEWWNSIAELISPDAMDTVSLLTEELNKEKSKIQADEGVSREFCFLFGNGNPVKSSESCRSKLARDFITEGIARRVSEDELRSRIFKFSDLGRVRVVCTFNKDALHLQKSLFTAPSKVSNRSNSSGRLFLGKYRCPKGVKDFIFDPEKRHGLKGHRARQFSVRVPVKGEDIEFGFEIQLMTLLQNAWDRRNHPFYEKVRENMDLSTELMVNDFSCAETLHLVDQQADRNWNKFLTEIKNEK